MLVTLFHTDSCACWKIPHFVTSPRYKCCLICRKLKTCEEEIQFKALSTLVGTPEGIRGISAIGYEIKEEYEMFHNTAFLKDISKTSINTNVNNLC